MWPYRNPLSIVFGAGSFTEVGALLGGRRYALITYRDPFFSDLQARLSELAGPPSLVVDDVAPNPDFNLLAEQTTRFSALAEAPQAIVALGGGSVIDSAKVFAAAKGDFAGVRRFFETLTRGTDGRHAGLCCRESNRTGAMMPSSNCIRQR